MAKAPEGFRHIRQAIDEMLESQHLKPRFDEAQLVASWEKLMGKSIAKRTRNVYVRNKVLFVELASPSMKQELGYHKADMLGVLEKEFGKGVVKEIVLM